MIINLLSDTVTKPGQGMLKAMFNAQVGDDVFKDDPTVNKLEEVTAKLFKKEAALFFPSGTMANQVAIKLHTQPGQQLICDKWAHVYNYEGGGAAFNSGVSCKLIDGERGMFTAAQVAENISDKNDIHQAETALVSIENTTNKGGGACWDLAEIKNIEQLCKKHDLPMHLDGARLFNALIAKDQQPEHIANFFDTISISLSKGLGCPVGSLLIGSKEHIEKALRLRKIFGGGMRQVGYLAAAGLYAFDHHIKRLAEDHLRAKKIADFLKTCSFIKKVEPIETNIIIFYTLDSIDPQDLVKKLAKKNILITGMGQGKLRIVTHLDFTDQMLDKLLTTFKDLF